MLYPDHIEQRFNNPPVGARLRADGAADQQQTMEHVDTAVSSPRDVVRLAASVAGNMVLGSLLLGSLLMAPLWLQSLLLPLP